MKIGIKMIRILIITIFLPTLINTPASTQLLNMGADYDAHMLIPNEERYDIQSAFNYEINTRGAQFSNDQFSLTRGHYGVTGTELSSIDMKFETGLRLVREEAFVTDIMCLGSVEDRGNLIFQNAYVQVMEINMDAECEEMSPDFIEVGNRSYRSTGVFVRDLRNNTAEVRFTFFRPNRRENIEFLIDLKLEPAPGQTFILRP